MVPAWNLPSQSENKVLFHHGINCEIKVNVTINSHFRRSYDIVADGITDQLIITPVDMILGQSKFS